ncbi:MAG: flavodoxin family protein [Thermodesulfobacteriota bacterium]
MKVLGIYGSPRKGGNTDILLSEVLKAAAEDGAETKSVYSRKLSIRGCVGCGGCDETGKCVVKDDMQDVYPLLSEADAVVLSAPIYFYNVPAALKAVIDRSQAMFAGRLLRKKGEELARHDSGRGYLIAVGATKGKNLFDGTELTARYFYDALDMDYCGGIFFRRVDKAGDIRMVEGALDQARELGRKIAAGQC